MQTQKQENNQVKQLAQQVEQLEGQLKQSTQQLQESQKQVQKLNQTKMQLEQEEIKMKYQIEWYKAQTDREYKEASAEEAKRRTEVEIQQLSDGNPYNDKVRQLSSDEH